MQTSKTQIADATKVEAIRQLGTYWQGGEQQRIYINNLEDVYGLVTARYASGNVCSATLDGEGISNGSARAICGRLAPMRFWFDLLDGRFHCRGEDEDDGGNDFRRLVRKIRETIGN